MSESEKNEPRREPGADEAASTLATGELVSTPAAPPAGQAVANRRTTWWDLALVPVLTVTALAMCFFLIGAAQRAGWIATAGDDPMATPEPTGAQRYICPMMCVQATTEPGRCPVCDMELVPATSGPAFIDASTRRILNIQTARVERRTATRAIRSVGELSYNESRLKTLSAYVDGRVEELYANYTGMFVHEGDPLALIYSPTLYAGQVELLVARPMVGGRDESPLRAGGPRPDLYASARRRLIELGMTSHQIDALERSGEATSRLELVAPMSGTVIEKLAVQGQYVREGEPIYRLADLSTVWLMLRLFPEDAALIRAGQTVAAEVQSLPGKSFTGEVEFVFPEVDPASRTVSVRVMIPNPEGELRIGDYARAELVVPLRAAEDDTSASAGPLLVPRDAVLMAGPSSVAYVETDAGRFEMRPVITGPLVGHDIVIVSGLAEGERVATRGNFLIDSQTQLAGNPSLLDPGRAVEKSLGDELTPEMLAALESLSPEDRELVRQQRLCVVADMPLGSMGTPIRVDVEGQLVFLCCEGCRRSLLNEPQQYLAKLRQLIEAQRQRDEAAPRHQGH